MSILSKSCTKCKEIKPFSEFNKNKNTKDGLQHYCNQCKKVINKERYLYDREKQITKVREWQSKNKDKTTEYRKKHQKHPHIKLRKKYHKKLKKILFKIKNPNLYCELVGCTKQEFVKHLENLWTENMNWDNYGDIWCLDHKIPLVSFNLSDPKDVSRAYHYTNTQPLYILDNIIKADKMPDGSLARNILK